MAVRSVVRHTSVPICDIVAGHGCGIGSALAEVSAATVSWAEVRKLPWNRIPLTKACGLSDGIIGHRMEHEGGGWFCSDSVRISAAHC